MQDTEKSCPQFGGRTVAKRQVGGGAQRRGTADTASRSQNEKRRPGVVGQTGVVRLVAGVGFEPTTFGL